MKKLLFIIFASIILACSSVHNSQELVVECIVILKVEVLTDGSVGSVVVIQSVMPGPGGLDEAAVKSVKNRKFSPAKKDGIPFVSWIKLPIKIERKKYYK